MFSKILFERERGEVDNETITSYFKVPVILILLQILLQIILMKNIQELTKCLKNLMAKDHIGNFEKLTV